MDNKDYGDLSKSLEKFQGLADLRLVLDSNEMGDECFETLMAGVCSLAQLSRLHLNVARNLLTVDSLMNNLLPLAELTALEVLEVEAKKNLKKIEDIDAVKQVLNTTSAKTKKVNL